MVNGKEQMSGNKDDKAHSTPARPGATGTPLGQQSAEESQAGRQEPDADGSTSLHDSEETEEAIRNSPEQRSRRGNRPRTGAR